MKKLTATLLCGMLTFCTVACGSTSGGNSSNLSTNSSSGDLNQNTAETGDTTGGAEDYFSWDENSHSWVPSSTKPEITTITYWSDAAAEEEIRTKQVEKFNSTIGQQYGIKMELTYFGGDYHDTVKTAAQSGSLPEIVKQDSKWLLDLIDGGCLIPYEDMPGSEELIAKYSGSLSPQSQIINGKTYTLPGSLTTYGFVINRTLWEKAGLSVDDYPKTWDDVVEKAEYITKNVDGAYGLAISSTLWTVSSWYTFGLGESIGHYGYDWNNKKFAYSDYDEFVKDVDKLCDEGCVVPGWTALDADGARAAFATGNVAMIGGASFDCAAYNNTYPCDFDWDVIEMPKLVSSKIDGKRFGLVTNLACVCNTAAESEEKLAKTLKCIELLYSDESFAELYSAGLYIPFRKEAIELGTTPELKNYDQWATWDEMFYRPMVPDNYITFEGKAYRQVMVDAWANPGIDDVDALMADVDERYNAALEEARKENGDVIDLYVIPDGTSPEKGK